MTVALYCRVSTDEQAIHGYSIGNQQERLIAYCKSQGWDDYRLYVDDGYTGTNMDRPALQRLIQHIEEDKIDITVVHKLDRLSRKQKDCLHLLEDVFERHNVAFKSATEPFDTSTPLGKAMLGILAVFAQLDRDMIVERLSGGLRQRLLSGKWSGGRVPFGYDYEPETGKLTVNEEQAELVRQVFRRYLSGHSLESIAEWLGARTQDRVCTHVTIRDMLDRRTYTGQLHFGELMNDQVAERIISEEMFEQVQTERKRRRDGLTAPGEYLLSGLLKCGQCGSSLVHVKYNQHGYKYDWYACRNQHYRSKDRNDLPRCHLGYRHDKELEATVIRQLRNAALNPARVEQEVKALTASEKSVKKSLSDLHKKIDTVDARLERWYDAFEQGNVDATALNARIDKLQSERQKLQLRIDELEDSMKPVNVAPLYSALELIDKAWDSLTWDEQREVLRTAIDHVVIPGKTDDPIIIWHV